MEPVAGGRRSQGRELREASRDENTTIFMMVRESDDNEGKYERTKTGGKLQKREEKMTHRPLEGQGTLISLTG